MRFSVIIPVYNREKTVVSAINSVVNQGFEDYELIVVDDGSEDNSLQVCKNIAKNNSKIKVIHKENGGVSSARNTGLRNATGDYILFLDSDDYFADNLLEELEKTIRSADADCYVFGLDDWMPPADYCNRILDKKVIAEEILPRHINILPQDDLFLRVSAVNKCFKREILAENDIRFDENKKTWEDNIFCVYYLIRCNSIYLTNQTKYRTGDWNSANNHLSVVYDYDMLVQYIDSYNTYVSQFGSEFQYDNPYTNRRYFKISNDILFKIAKTAPKREMKRYIVAMCRDKAFCFWAQRVETENEEEAELKNAILKKDVRKLLRIYSPTSRKQDFKLLLWKAKNKFAKTGK